MNAALFSSCLLFIGQVLVIIGSVYFIQETYRASNSPRPRLPDYRKYFLGVSVANLGFILWVTSSLVK